MITTIQLDKKTKKTLDSLKIHPRESYNEVIKRISDSSIDTNVDKESLIETIEVLSDPEAMRSIANALEEIEKGNYGKPLGQVKKELGLNGL